MTDDDADSATGDGRDEQSERDEVTDRDEQSERDGTTERDESTPHGADATAGTDELRFSESATDDDDRDVDTDRADSDGAHANADAPLAAAAERAARRRADRDADESGTEDDEFEAYFEDESVGDIDTDQVWERLADDASPEVGIDERTVREIDAHRYCHQCEHFSEPPEVACTHEGTTIIEMPSLSRFRVTNCPVVREEEALEDGSSGP